MRRREFIALFGGAAAWPIAARAQQSTMALVGLLSGAQRDDREISAVRQGLKDAETSRLVAVMNGGACAGFLIGRGVLAKNDRLDARLIAEYVAIMPTRVVSGTLRSKNSPRS